MITREDIVRTKKVKVDLGYQILIWTEFGAVGTE
jgi:hypothetical protein